MNTNKMRTTPPPMPNQHPLQKKKSKTPIILGAVGAFFAICIIFANLNGSNGERGYNEQISKLQADSVKLQRNFESYQRFAELHELAGFVNEIRELGDFYHSAHTTADSVRLYEDPTIATLANYNVQRSEEILSGLLPKCREHAVSILVSKLNTPAHETTVTMDSTKLYITSEIYKAKRTVEFEADRILPHLRDLEFTSVTFATPADVRFPYAKEYALDITDRRRLYR